MIEKIDKFTVSETAKILRVEMKTIRSWDNRGLFPSLKDENNRKYYSREQIKAKLISLGAKEYGKE